MKPFNKVFCAFISLILCSPLLLSASALHADVNNDDYIGTEDAILALRFATGLQIPDEYQQHVADLDYDGEITTEDVRLILRGAADIDYVPDHLFSNWETVTHPTCTENGMAKCYCYYCEKEVRKVLYKTDHTVVPATCEKGSYCSVCNKVFTSPSEHEENEGYCIHCKKLLCSPSLSYKGKEVDFGCSASTIKNILGEPKNKYKDAAAEKTVVIYVYYTDYTDLAVFTLADGKLTQFFSNCATAKVQQGNTHFGLYCKATPENIGDIALTTYEDQPADGLKYSFCATVGEAYTLKMTTDYTLLSKLNVHLTNGLRAINSVPALKYCADASAVAAAHSNDMAKRNYFNHTSPEGNRVSNRLDEAGIEWYSCGENIVAGYYDPYGISNGWYNSEGHRKNILNKNFKYLGVGFAYNSDSDYKYYGTQSFYTDEY